MILRDLKAAEASQNLVDMSFNIGSVKALGEILGALPVDDSEATDILFFTQSVTERIGKING